MTARRSNQNTGFSNSQVDHYDTPRSVGQHSSSNLRSSFGTLERRKRAREHADSSRSEQKCCQETRHAASTDSSEDETSDKTNESQHSDIDETSETHQNNSADEESKPEDIQHES